MYNVVFRNIHVAPKEIITWSSFESKEHFDKWYDEKMQSWYEVVDQGVTPERAVELCSSPQAVGAILLFKMSELHELLSRI